MGLNAYADSRKKHLNDRDCAPSDHTDDCYATEIVDIVLVLAGPLLAIVSFTLYSPAVINPATDHVAGFMTWIINIPILGWIVAAAGGFLMIGSIGGVLIVIPGLIADIIGRYGQTDKESYKP